MTFELRTPAFYRKAKKKRGLSRAHIVGTNFIDRTILKGGDCCNKYFHQGITIIIVLIKLREYVRFLLGMKLAGIHRFFLSLILLFPHQDFWGQRLSGLGCQEVLRL